ncbi:MAG: TraR/DksA family transcriptional regulator [Verrucomicrobiota bacterium]
MMTLESTETLRRKLVSQRDRVLAEMADHRLLDRHTDLEEKADLAAKSFVEARITENDGNFLQKIEFALERLEAGTYERCNHCGGEIPIERLEAKPSVSLCVACQQLKDSGRIS